MPGFDENVPTRKVGAPPIEGVNEGDLGFLPDGLSDSFESLAYGEEEFEHKFNKNDFYFFLLKQYWNSFNEEEKKRIKNQKIFQNFKEDEEYSNASFLNSVFQENLRKDSQKVEFSKMYSDFLRIFNILGVFGIKLSDKSIEQVNFKIGSFKLLENFCQKYLEIASRIPQNLYKYLEDDLNLLHIKISSNTNNLFDDILNKNNFREISDGLQKLEKMISIPEDVFLKTIFLQNTFAKIIEKNRVISEDEARFKRPKNDINASFSDLITFVDLEELNKKLKSLENKIGLFKIFSISLTKKFFRNYLEQMKLEADTEGYEIDEAFLNLVLNAIDEGDFGAVNAHIDTFYEEL